MSNISYPTTGDEHIRVGAFARVAELVQVYSDNIPWAAIAQGFGLSGERILLANRAVGIFKPNQLESGALSIKTTMPRQGRVNIYSDAEDVDGTFIYSLQGDDPANHYNRALRECMDNQWPLIYFHAVAAGFYKAICPCFIESIDTKSMTCRVSVASEISTPNLKDSEAWRIERRYVMRATKARLHQAEFRERVLSAYGNCCAMTRLPVPELLEAVHIMPDSHELGIAAVQNGICLSRMHHRAFDANLIGVTPDYKVQVSDRLMAMTDGVILEGGIKALNGHSLTLPRESVNWPSKELLEIRFNQFRNWTWS
jgi:putative restriction endonuclease